MSEQYLTGRIIKGIAGFYYVDVPLLGVFECKAKGSFRKEGIKPLVGDVADILVVDENEKTGHIEKIHTRSSVLTRPPAANADQVLLVFSVLQPSPNLTLLDRYLVNMEYLKMPVVICLNKEDLDDRCGITELKEVYDFIGYRTIITSAKENSGIDELKMLLKDKVTVVAGPSGAGKSSLINRLQTGVLMDTDVLMKKMDSGKQTTRHAQLIPVEENTYIMDTPGFGSAFLPQMSEEELDDLFPEMREKKDGCYFTGCAHIHEPDCCVRNAVEAGEINSLRYRHYLDFYEELKQARKY